MSKKQTEQPILADEVLGKSEEFVIKYKKAIVGGILAIIVCVLGFILYSMYVTAPKEAAANNAIFKAQQYFAQNDFETALNGDGVNAGFLKVIEDHSGTDAANLAYAYAGFCNAQLGNIDEAINNLENFDGNDKILAPKAMQTLALCYAHKENLDKAISLLIDAAETAQNTAISPRCLMDAAAMYEQQGNSNEAKKLYEQIKKEYPNSPEAGNIDKFINSIN